MASIAQFKTVDDLCKYIGREGYAIDFQVDVNGSVDSISIDKLIGKSVHVTAEHGIGGSLSGEVTDISKTMLYIDGDYRNRGKHEVKLADITSISWSETIHKRIMVHRSKLNA